MKLFPLVLFILAFNAQAGTKADCGVFEGPEYFANLTILDFAQKNGVATAKALCKIEPQYCDENEQVKFGIQQVFIFVQKLPNRFTSQACAALGDECQKRCEATSLYADKECFVECNRNQSN